MALESLFSKIKSMVVKEDEFPGLAVKAPISGDVIPLEDVPDVLYSECIVGEGIAIKPCSNRVLAPFDGVVTKIFETNHCVVVTSTGGIDVLIHVGIDTVDLAGLGFTRLAEQGQEVKAGDPLIELDIPVLEKHAKSTITPVVVINGDDCHMKKIHAHICKAVAGQNCVMHVETEES